MGCGFSEILSGELQGSPARYAIQGRALQAFDASLGRRLFGPGISSERTAALMAGANEIVYGYYSVVNGALRATLVEEAVASRKMTRTDTVAGPLRDGIFPLADRMAKLLGGAYPFGTRSQRALRGYVVALEAPNAAAASGDLAEALAADPNFGRAYTLWLDAALADGDRAGAEKILGQARAHQDRFTALDRAALDLAAAELHRNFHAQVEALRALTRLDPADPNHHRTLAEALVSLRRYPDAIAEFRQALAIRPDDIMALNSMGYAAAFSGDLPAAVRALRAYERLRPNEANPLDSLGDAYFALGHFGEAERFYLAAQAKAPAFLNGGELLKATQARLMTGEVPGATALFKRYLSARQAAHGPDAAYNAAAWSWYAGRRQAAVAALDQVARADASGPLRAIASRADAQAAIWLLELGDRAAAVEHARLAVKEAVPATSAEAGLAAFLAQPDAFPAPSEPPFSDYAQAYALLFARQFQPAIAVLQGIFQRPANDPDDGLAVLLAWAYIETGDFQHAEPLLRLTPLPQASGFGMFSSLVFPRLFELRGKMFDHLGQREAAQRCFQVFRKLSGSAR